MQKWSCSSLQGHQSEGVRKFSATAILVDLDASRGRHTVPSQSARESLKKLSVCINSWWFKLWRYLPNKHVSIKSTFIKTVLKGTNKTQRQMSTSLHDTTIRKKIGHNLPPRAFQGQKSDTHKNPSYLLNKIVRSRSFKMTMTSHVPVWSLKQNGKWLVLV